MASSTAGLWATSSTSAHSASVWGSRDTASSISRDHRRLGEPALDRARDESLHAGAVERDAEQALELRRLEEPFDEALGEPLGEQPVGDPLDQRRGLPGRQRLLDGAGGRALAGGDARREDDPRWQEDDLHRAGTSAAGRLEHGSIISRRRWRRKPAHWWVGVVRPRP
jgi:hypothetical protein